MFSILSIMTSRVYIMCIIFTLRWFRYASRSTRLRSTLLCYISWSSGYRNIDDRQISISERSSGWAINYMFCYVAWTLFPKEGKIWIPIANPAWIGCNKLSLLPLPPSLSSPLLGPSSLPPPSPPLFSLRRSGAPAGMGDWKSARMIWQPCPAPELWIDLYSKHQWETISKPGPAGSTTCTRWPEGKRRRCEKLWRGNFCSWQQMKIDCNL